MKSVLSVSSSFLASKAAENAVHLLRGNTSVNFNSLKLENSGTFFQIPSLSQPIRLNAKNILSTRSFSPFISASSVYNKGLIKIYNSHFSDYRAHPIRLSSLSLNAVVISLKNKEYKKYYADENNKVFFYNRNQIDIDLSVDYCSFENCKCFGKDKDPYHFTSCGGALFAANSDSVNVRRSFFNDCASYYCGGAAFFSGIKNTIKITECNFVNTTSQLGTAFGILDSNSDISFCSFTNCKSNMTDKSGLTGTIYIMGATSESIVSYCSFIKNGFSSKGYDKAAYGEITTNQNGIREASLNVRFVCVENITFEDEEFYSLILSGPTNIVPKFESITCTHNGIYILIYWDAKFKIQRQKLLNNINTICQLSLHRTPNSTPRITPSATIGPTAIPSLEPTISATIEMTAEKSQIPTPDSSPNETPEVPNPTAQQTCTPTPNPSLHPSITEQLTTNLSITTTTTATTTTTTSSTTTTTKILISCSVIGSLIIIVLVVFIVLFCTRDNRKAFFGDVQSAEELAFPEIEVESPSDRL